MIRLLDDDPPTVTVKTAGGVRDEEGGSFELFKGGPLLELETEFEFEFEEEEMAKSASVEETMAADPDDDVEEDGTITTRLVADCATLLLTRVLSPTNCSAAFKLS